MSINALRIILVAQPDAVAMGKGNMMVTSARFQSLLYFGVGLVIIAFTALLYRQDSHFFERYFGQLNVLSVVVAVVVLGMLLSYVLFTRGWSVYRTWNPPWLLMPASLAMIFALVIVLVDIAGVFSSEINVPFPQSLLFYPIMGFVVEVVFHLLPMALLLIGLPMLFPKLSYAMMLWPSLVVIALLEPTYQSIVGSAGIPLWAVAYVFVHIFLINLVELAIFQRYDFVSMYSFRLFYYLLWHILWGYLRLYLLF